MTDREQAMFEAIAQQLCTSIDNLTTAVGEGARRLEGALGSLEAEVMQIYQDLQDMHTSLRELEALADIKDTLKGLVGGMPL